MTKHRSSRLNTLGALARTQQLNRLRTVAYAMPLIAQIMMIVMLLIQHQWMFAMMIGSGCIATAATLLISSVQHHKEVTASARDDCTHETHTQHSATLALSQRIASPSLQALLDMEDDPVPLRTIMHHWLTASLASYAVPVGIDIHDQPSMIDIVHDGPHAIVAGTTGSGKSVLLQDWCIALACTYCPQDVQFVLLDFKGGSAMNQLAGLPHVRGCVNDLDLRYATRALLALERELRDREQLAAQLGVADVMDAPGAVARLIIIVDEFHMLHGQLPDYIDRLVHIASLGRSLGMHLIACTQNPLGQISASMKANMSLRVCLRVRDALQSQEMLNTDDAAHISASAPGMAITQHDDMTHYLQCAHIPHLDTLITHIQYAAQLYPCPTVPPLFTAPLPARVTPNDYVPTSLDDYLLPIGVLDDGVTCRICTISLATTHSLAVIGQPSRGKTTLLTWIAQYAQRHHLAVTCMDDVDDYLDPMNMNPQAIQLRERFPCTQDLFVFSVSSSRRLRIPDHGTTRLVFPTGDRAVDLADGIAPDLLRILDAQDYRTAGRAVLIQNGQSHLVQLFDTSLSTTGENSTNTRKSLAKS